MTLEIDQPFGRRRWDPPTGIEASTANEANPAIGGEEKPVAPQPAAPDATG